MSGMSHPAFHLNIFSAKNCRMKSRPVVIRVGIKFTFHNLNLLLFCVTIKMNRKLLHQTFSQQLNIGSSWIRHAVFIF